MVLMRAILLSKLKVKKLSPPPPLRLEVSAGRFFIGLEIKWSFIVFIVLIAWFVWPRSPHIIAETEPPKVEEKLEAPTPLEAIPQAVFPPAPIIPVPKPKPVPEAPNCGTDPYMAFIYSHESGCRTTAVNSIGCRGLGQACPGSKLPCGADWACQDAWFKNYALQRYGSFLAAYNFWLAHRWW